MGDTISRQAAVDIGVRMLDANGVEWVPVEAIKALPSAQPERKTGMWIGYFEPGCENYHCSACGTAWDPSELYLGGNDYPKFCPECGAQMENWKSEEEDGE